MTSYQVDVILFFDWFSICRLTLKETEEQELIDSVCSSLVDQGVQTDFLTPLNSPSSLYKVLRED